MEWDQLSDDVKNKKLKEISVSECQKESKTERERERVCVWFNHSWCL